MSRYILLISAFLATTAFATDESKEPAVMLRAGTWDGGVGTYHVPDAFAKLKTSSWPVQGWHRMRFFKDRIETTVIPAPRMQMPAFLKSITTQVSLAASGTGDPKIGAQQTFADENILYLRVPGVALREGAIPVYIFKNGTPQLRPMLDHTYELSFGGQAFAMTVRNGFRANNGQAYGSGAQYTIEYGGEKYEYGLGEYGWDSTIAAITDLDGDGKPDFHIHVGGNNSGYEFILLSSKAKPGRNPPSASLYSTGC
jgi:hypothetical protein